jgi:hypothetical protein
MISQLGNLRRGFTLVKSLLALGCAAAAMPLTSQAVIITNFVETPTSLSFDFSGTAHFDFINASLPALSFWSTSFESHSFPAGGPFVLTLGGIQHLGGPAGTVSVSGAYGTTQTDIVPIAHGVDLDVYTLTATVFGVPGGPGWSSYSGSFSAVHVPNGVPDGGATAALAGLAVLLLAGARRFFRTA